jgi:tetratricopeptide (TPR) repeat protein
LSEAASLVENSPDVESDILLVSNAFSDIEKTPSVWKAIAMAFFAYKLYDQCLKYLTKCLEMTESDTERYHMLCFIGDVELSLSQLTDDGEEEIEHIHKAYDSINKGLGMMVKEEVRSFAERETWKSILQGDITNRGRCEIKLGKLDKAIESLGEAYGLIDNVDEFFIKDLTSELEKRGEYEKLISVVHQLKLWDLLYWIGFHTAQGHETFQHAAVESRNQAFLIETYERLIKQVDSFELGAHIRIQLAAIYQFVVPNYSEAKRLLFEIVDPQKGTKFQDADEDSVFNARLQIADILMEQFRAAVDPKEKIALASETKNLALQHSLAISNDFNPYESQTAITLALMLAKLGPMSEFQDLIEKTFQVCIAALTDTLAWNDSQGFRLLAKVLSFVPDMKRDAQIAYTLQFSNVDDKILHPPEEAETAENEEGKEGLRNEEVNAATKELPIGDTPSKAAAELPGETVQDDPPEAKVEDLNPASDIYCNGCSRTFSDWTKGSVYMCIVCTNCDLCEECWTKRDRCNKGEEWKDWKRYCGDDHRYIRGPIKGWKGVKDGVLRLAGEDGKEMIEILFTQWVAGIQDRWKEAWLGFWKRDVLVVNIL